MDDPGREPECERWEDDSDPWDDLWDGEPVTDAPVTEGLPLGFSIHSIQTHITCKHQKNSCLFMQKKTNHHFISFSRYCLPVLIVTVRKLVKCYLFKNRITSLTIFVILFFRCEPGLAVLVCFFLHLFQKEYRQKWHIFAGEIPFLSLNRQWQSTEGNWNFNDKFIWIYKIFQSHLTCSHAQCPINCTTNSHFAVW